VISVAANVDPVRMVSLYEAAGKGDWKKALTLHYVLSPLFRAMFIDTNPIPVKKAVELMGMAGGPVRLPLDNLDDKKTQELKKVLAAIPGVNTAERSSHVIRKTSPLAVRKPALALKKHRR